MLTLLLACVPLNPPPEPAPVDARAALRSHMQEHQAHATAALDGVLSGDVERAREDLRWIAEHPAQPGEPATWGNWLNQVRVAAAEGAQAAELREQARAVAQLGNACGGCHQSLGLDTWGPLPPPVPEGPGHGPRYRWAVDRLWEAMLVGSAQPWQTALEVLVGDPVVPGASLPEQAWAGEVPVAAQAALGDDNPDTRADLFGQLLGACGACHGASRR